MQTTPAGKPTSRTTTVVETHEGFNSSLSLGHVRSRSIGYILSYWQRVTSKQFINERTVRSRNYGKRKRWRKRAVLEVSVMYKKCFAVTVPFMRGKCICGGKDVELLTSNDGS